MEKIVYYEEEMNSLITVSNFVRYKIGLIIIFLGKSIRLFFVCFISAYQLFSSSLSKKESLATGNY